MRSIVLCSLLMLVMCCCRSTAVPSNPGSPALGHRRSIRQVKDGELTEIDVDNALSGIEAIKDLLKKVKKSLKSKPVVAAPIELVPVGEDSGEDCECVMESECSTGKIIAGDYCPEKQVCCSATGAANRFDEEQTLIPNCGLNIEDKVGVEPSPDGYDDSLWTILVRQTSVGVFTGVIIHPNAALALASNAKMITAGRALAQIGGMPKFNIKHSLRKVKEVVLHPKHSDGPHNDLAILIWDLPAEANVDLIIPCISKNEVDLKSKECLASEFEKDENTQSWEKKTFKLDVLFDKECKQGTLCAKKMDVCPKEKQGGPTVCIGKSYQRFLVGLNTFGKVCSEELGMVDVTAHYGWIEEVFKKHNLFSSSS